ncbi:hypothetical protein ACFQXA_22790 [Nocardiopsis composta]
MLVASLLPAAPLVLLGHGLRVWESRDAVYHNGALEPLSDPGPLLLFSSGVLAVLWLALVPVVLGAPVLIGTAALLGRTVGVRDAWRFALRRYFTVLTWFLLVAALAAAVAVGVIALTVAEVPLWLTLALVALPGLSALVPLMVMLPLALAEGHGPWRGLAAAYRSGRGHRRMHLMFAVASCGLGALAGDGVDRLLQTWPGWGDRHPGAEMIGLLTSAAVIVPAILLLCAPVVYRDYDAIAGYGTGPDLERIATHLPPPHTGGRTWAVLPMPALVVLLLLPALAGPTVLWANPFGAPYLQEASGKSLTQDDYVVDISPRGKEH